MTAEIQIPVDLIDSLRAVGIDPVDVVLYVTSRCNLRCAHCYVGNPLLDLASGYESRSLVGFINSIPRINRVTVLGGEPLLYSNLLEVLNALDRPQVVERRLTTNLTVLPDATLRRLLSARFRLCVSVDGHTAELHELIRGRRTFEKTVTNLRRVIADGHDVEVTHTVTALSAPHILETVEFLRDAGIRRLNLHKISPRGNAIDSPELDVSATEWRHLISTLEGRARSDSDGLLVRYEVLFCTDSELETMVASGAYAPHAARSFYASGGHRIVLYPDGRLYISSEAFGTESYVGAVDGGRFIFNGNRRNELTLYRKLKDDLRMSMINPRLQGDEAFPVVLSVSFRRQLYV